MSTLAIRCVTLKAGTGESGGVGKKLLRGESPELLTSSRLSVPLRSLTWNVNSSAVPQDKSRHIAPSTPRIINNRY